MYYLKHFNDLFFKLGYLIISFILLFWVSFLYKKEICYFLIKPFLLVTYIDNYLYTGLVDVFYIYLKLILSFSIFFIIPLLLIFIINFLKIGLYIFEYIFIQKYILNMYVYFILFNFIFYYFLLPYLSFIFIGYQLIDKYDVFNFNLEIIINNYLYFIIYIYIISYLFIYLYLNFYILLFNNKYKNLNKFFLYLIVCICVVGIAPPVISIQFIFLLFIIFIIEIINLLFNYYLIQAYYF